MSFCITGALSRPRKAIEADIEARGGKIVSSVSAQTSYLITNETEPNSDKFKAAQKYHIPILTESQLTQKLAV